MRQQGALLAAEFFEIRLAFRARLDLECGKGRAQRPPFQSGHRDIVDIIALPQPRRQLGDIGTAPAENSGSASASI